MDWLLKNKMNFPSHLSIYGNLKQTSKDTTRLLSTTELESPYENSERSKLDRKEVVLTHEVGRYLIFEIKYWLIFQMNLFSQIFLINIFAGTKEKKFESTKVSNAGDSDLSAGISGISLNDDEINSNKGLKGKLFLSPQASSLFGKHTSQQQPNVWESDLKNRTVNKSDEHGFSTVIDNPPNSTANSPTSTANPPTSTANPPISTANPPTSTARPPTLTGKPQFSTAKLPSSTAKPSTSSAKPSTWTAKPSTSITKQPQDHDSNFENAERHWFENYELQKGMHKEANSSSSDSDLWESNEEEEEMEEVNEELNKDEVLRKMNSFLKTVPSSFQIRIPYSEISPYCNRESITLHDFQKGSKNVSKVFFVPKFGHNVIAKYFRLTNPYCTLVFTKKKILQDFQLKNDVLKLKNQIVLYATCSNHICKPSFCFKINRVPVDAEYISVDFRYNSYLNVAILNTHKKFLYYYTTASLILRSWNTMAVKIVGS